MSASGNDNGMTEHPGAAQPGRQDGRVHTYGMGRGAARPAPQPSHQPQQPQQPQLHQQPLQQKRKKPASFWIAIVVALVCAALACFLALTMCDPKGQRAGDPGQLTNKSPEEIQAELDRVVEEGMFNISIASVIEFADGHSEGEVRIENVPGNRYLMQVVITLDDTGQQVYETGVIEPDHHIQKDALDVDLPAGTYAATAVFHALDPETEEEVGQAAAKVSLVVYG